MRFADFEQRLAAIEDRLAIYQILSAYAPVMDGGGEEESAEFFAEDGAYIVDVPGAQSAYGRDEVLSRILQSPLHRQAVRDGISHMLGFPHIAINGDQAEAVTYACIFRSSAQGWYVSRIAASSFQLVRQLDGWRIAKRSSRALDSEEGRAIFSNATWDLPWLPRASTFAEMGKN